MTYEEYQGKELQWMGRVFYPSDGMQTYPTGTAYLLIHKNLLNLPDYIKGTATGQVIKIHGLFAKRIERGWMMDPRYSDSAQVMAFWYFTDDPTRTPH